MRFHGLQMVWSWVSGKFGMDHRGFTVVVVLFFFFGRQWRWQRLIFVGFGCRLLGLLNVFFFFFFGGSDLDVVLGGRFCVVLICRDILFNWISYVILMWCLLK